MPRYLVEAYAPGSASASDLKKRITEAARTAARQGAAVRHLSSIHVPSDETCFHLFEAESAEAVHRVVVAADVVAQRIVEAAS